MRQIKDRVCELLWWLGCATITSLLVSLLVSLLTFSVRVTTIMLKLLFGG